MLNEMNHAEVAKKLEEMAHWVNASANIQTLSQAAADERRIANGELIPAPVYCKDCAYQDYCERTLSFSENGENLQDVTIYFCSYGKRKDGAE